MDRESNRAFTRQSESLVKPADVTAISFLGDFNKILPLKAQRKIMKRGNRGIPYMGFIVAPYSFFASYEIRNAPLAEALLPAGYELLDTALFDGEAKRPSVVIGVFSARTSAFAGTRMEAYVIARRKSDGQAAWIIVDYVTDTNSYDPARGFTGYNGDPALITTTPYGELLVDMVHKESRKRFSLQADLRAGKNEALDRVLWVDGNMAVDYGGDLRDPSAKAFSLIFDPALMREAMRIPPESVTIVENSFLTELIDGNAPLSFACFPFGQHYIIKQDLAPGEIRSEADLEAKAAEFAAATGFKRMRGDDLKKPILVGMIVSAVVTYGVIVFLLIKVLS